MESACKIFSKITACHYVLPRNVEQNSDLAVRFGEKKMRSVEKISGIVSRRVAPKGVCASDLGFAAASRMIEKLNIKKEEIDCLVFASQTPDYILPSTAAVLHEKLGLSSSCGAFDVSMGCPAFIYSLSIANGMIASGQCKKILLIVADTITKLINPLDFGLVPLHGDGAACFLVEKSDGKYGIEGVDFGTDSSLYEALIVKDGGFRNPISENSATPVPDKFGAVRTAKDLQMDGAAVFHFSLYKVPEEISKAMQKFGVSLADLDKVLLHQANKTMVAQIYKMLGVPPEKQFYFMEKIGNLSAASSAVLLVEALRRGTVAQNARVLVSAFGVGLSWGTAILKTGETLPETLSDKSDFEL